MRSVQYGEGKQIKFIVAHYKKANSDWLVNGGKLIVTDREYILKCFLKTLARFEADKVLIKKIPDNISYKGISVSDGKKEYYLYFFSGTANDLYQMLNIH